MEVISRYDVLKEINTGKPFDLIFITADRKRKTGGKIVTVKGYKKAKADNFFSDNISSEKIEQRTDRRNPNHRMNKTINIINPRNELEHPVTVHWRLMVFFNNKRIVQ